MEKLYQITAPHYCAGVVVEGGVCREAAPILHWAVGKPWPWLLSYFARKKFGVILVDYTKKGEYKGRVP